MYNAGFPIVNKDGTPTRSFYAFCRSVWGALGGENNISVPQQVENNKQSIETETEERQEADQNVINNVDTTLEGYYTKEQTDTLINDTLGDIETLLSQI